MPCDCKPKVLIVEDDGMQLMVTAMQFRNHFPGVTIDEAEDGQVAVNKFNELINNNCNCANNVYGLIVMDLLMPVKDGFAASREIKEIAASKGLGEKPFIVAVSSNDLNAEVQAQLSAIKVTEYIEKPISADAIKGMMAKAGMA